jgi:hypothetical protein
VVAIAPVITHTAVTSQGNGQALQINASISDTAATATLHYRRGGDPAFTTLAMSPSGGNFQATIPAGDVTTRGLEYYLAATGLGGSTRQPSSGVFAVRVSVSGEGVAKGSAQPAGSEQTAYRLISVPMDITSNTVQSVLFDDLGSYDNTKWRFFELRADSQYHEYPAASALAKGKAYWLIVKDAGKIIDTGPGSSVVTNIPFTVSLNQGWNFVSTPFNFTIPISKLSLGNSGAIQPRSFLGTGWDTPGAVTSLQPFEGYALNVTTATTLTINPDMSPAPPPGQSPNTRASISWSIAIKAKCEQAEDVDNLAAVSPDASAERDNLDWMEPPTIGAFVSVYFPHAQDNERVEKMCVDVRPVPTEGEVWDFAVRTNIRKPVRLAFENIASVPPEFSVMLVDEVLKTTQDVRERGSYVVPAKQTADPSRYKLLAGKPEFIQQQIALNNLIPTSYELSQNFPTGSGSHRESTCTDCRPMDTAVRSDSCC